MPFSDVEAKTTITGFSVAERAIVLNVLQTAYNGSTIAKAMFDNWIATAGNTISIKNVAGVFQAFTGTGRVEIDLSYISDLSYINDTGTAVLHSPLGAIVHELGHALTGRRDSVTATDYQGDNVRYVNTIWEQLGLEKEISYIAQARNTLHEVGYQYTNGAAIDAAETGDRNWNSSALGNSKDLLIGGSSANALESGEGNDFIVGAGGNDVLNGGAGTADTGVFFGKPVDYDIRQNTDGSWTVRHARGARDEGADTLKNIEKVQFDGGETFDLKKHGLTFQTDFALVIDTTGSMGDDIDSVKAQGNNLINALLDGKTDARIGIVGFKDENIGEPTSVILKFTDQDSFAARKSAALTALNGITVGGGGDLPETYYHGLLAALDGRMGEWRAGAGVLRIAAFTDAPANDADLAGQVAALAATIGATISGRSSATGFSSAIDTFEFTFADDAQGLDPSGDPNDDPLPPYAPSNDPIAPDRTVARIEIYSIFTGPTGTDTAALESIAATTGGEFLTATTGDDLVAALLKIITAPPTPEPEPANVVAGGVRDDLIRGVATNDIIFGREGDDRLLGDAGNDRLYGGDGSDRLYGGDGDDLAFGEDGGDTAFGEAGDDGLYGGDGGDLFYGGDGGDTLNGGDGDDRLYGGDGVDKIFGSGGDDAVFGEAGDDLALGGDGDDRLSGGDGNDRLQGADGEDVLNGGGANDRLEGGDGGDRLIGGAGSDRLLGGDGADGFDGGAGDDSVFGEAGDDVALAGAGDDRLIGGAGRDVLYGGDGADGFDGGAGDDSMFGQAGDDVALGGAGIDRLNGGADRDRLFGGDGADYLEGGDGNDRLHGGGGRDALSGDAGRDIFVFDTPPNAAEPDVILGFVSADDRLEIDVSAFRGGLVAGGVPQLVANAQPNAAGFSAGVFLYDTDNGSLSFDVDGQGVNAAIRFAVLAGAPTFLAEDIALVA